MFNAGGFAFSMQGYLQYANSHKDDNALYLFDRLCFNAIPELTEAFEVPPYFTDDQFAYLEQERPDYRWIIIGAAAAVCVGLEAVPQLLTLCSCGEQALQGQAVHSTKIPTAQVPGTQ